MRLRLVTRVLGVGQYRVHWRGVTFFARQPQVFDEAPHGRHADAQALLSLQLCTQLRECGIRLLVHEAAHAGERGLITNRTTAARVRSRGDVPGRPAPSEYLFNK